MSLDCKNRIESLDMFLSELSKLKDLRKHLTDLFQDQAKDFFDELECNDLVYNAIEDYIENNSKVIHKIFGKGDFGKFPILIFNYGPLFWLSAQEFDLIKYFKSKDDALSCIYLTYFEFLN